VIYPIKVFDADDNLKRIISSKQATKHYDKSLPVFRRDDYKVFDSWIRTERDAPKPIKLEPIPSMKRYKQPEKKYEITCANCGKVVMKAIKRAKHCSTRCTAVVASARQYVKIKAARLKLKEEAANETDKEH